MKLSHSLIIIITGDGARFFFPSVHRARGMTLRNLSVARDRSRNLISRLLIFDADTREDLKETKRHLGRFFRPFSRRRGNRARRNYGGSQSAISRLGYFRTILVRDDALPANVQRPRACLEYREVSSRAQHRMFRLSVSLYEKSRVRRVLRERARARATIRFILYFRL